jgi:hypothetical protein
MTSDSSAWPASKHSLVTLRASWPGLWQSLHLSTYWGLLGCQVGCAVQAASEGLPCRLAHPSVSTRTAGLAVASKAWYGPCSAVGAPSTALCAEAYMR